MVNYCVAYGCNVEYNPQTRISFFRFPFNRPEILELWIEAVRRESWYPSKSSKLCGKHFLPSDFQIKPGCIRKILKPDAVPSMFSFPDHILKEDALPGRNRKVLKQIETLQNEDEKDIINEETITIKIEDLRDESEYMENIKVECEYQQDLPHNEEMDTSTQSKELVDQETQTPFCNKIFLLRRKVKSLRQKLRRRDMQVSKMKEFLKEIRKSGYAI